MRTKKHRLILVDIHEKDNKVTPWYYFEFDKLNELGFSDNEMFGFIEEMKTMAEKEIKERSNKEYDKQGN